MDGWLDDAEQPEKSDSGARFPCECSKGYLRMDGGRADVDGGISCVVAIEGRW